MAAVRRIRDRGRVQDVVAVGVFVDLGAQLLDALAHRSGDAHGGRVVGAPCTPGYDSTRVADAPPPPRDIACPPAGSANISCAARSWNSPKRQRTSGAKRGASLCGTAITRCHSWTARAHAPLRVRPPLRPDGLP